MNKPIINGIDVSECAYFNSVTYEEPYCNIDQEHLYTCSSDENCYFKQLKRLQKENEELKKRQITKNGFICDCEQNAKYKQALEEIREIAVVNSLNTCWTILNNCENCHDNNECGEQSPIAKLKFIKDKVNEVLNDRD